MEQRTIDAYNIYKDEIKWMTEKYQNEPDKLQEEIEKLECQMAGMVSRSKLEDKEKIEILNILTTEAAKYEIVVKFKKDVNKVKCLEQFHDQWYIVKIVGTICSDELKLKALKYIKENGNKVKIFVTLKDKEKILNFLENDPVMKNEVVQFLKDKMKYDAYELWNFMKSANLENQLIPYLVFDSKFEILNDRYTTDEMKQDIKNYLGKPIPENLEEMSIYERVGVDLDALNGEVITSIEQLGLNEFQKKYLSTVGYGTIENGASKIKIPIKDFEGTFSPTLTYGVSTPKDWKALLMGLKRMAYNIKKHSEDVLFNPEYNDCQEDLKLQCINGKYYVGQNGNHRMTLLKAKYLSEIKAANGDIKRIAEIEEKYTIEVSCALEIPSNANELMGINAIGIIGDATDKNIKIKELIEDGKKIGYVLTNGYVESIVKSEELQLYIQQEIVQLKEMSDGQLFEKFKKKIQSLNLDSPENEEYKQAFETMTGISIELKQKQEILESENKEQEIIGNEQLEGKTHEQPQPYFIKNEEESFRDELGENEKNDIDLWMSRFRRYNSAIDRVSQNAKAKFIKIKSDIIKMVKDNLKERNAIQLIDTDERW